MSAGRTTPLVGSAVDHMRKCPLRGRLLAEIYFPRRGRWPADSRIPRRGHMQLSSSPTTRQAVRRADSPLSFLKASSVSREADSPPLVGAVFDRMRKCPPRGRLFAEIYLPRCGHRRLYSSPTTRQAVHRVDTALRLRWRLCYSAGRTTQVGRCDGRAWRTFRRADSPFLLKASA